MPKVAEHDWENQKADQIGTGKSGKQEKQFQKDIQQSIAAGKRKRPKSLENQGLWAMVPVTGPEYTMAHPAETPGGNSPPDCCIYMGSSPSPWIQKSSMSIVGIEIKHK